MGGFIMKHIMIDLETMGVTPQAPIVSVGAVMFDPDTRKIGRKMSGKTFYAELDWEWQDRKPCESTVQWWSEQSKEARDALGCATGIIFAKYAIKPLITRDSVGVQYSVKF